VGQIESTIEVLGRARGLELQCLASPTSIHVVHDGRARLARPPAAGIDLGVQARLSRAVRDEVGGASHTRGALEEPVELGWSLAGEASLWCLLALTAAVSMGGTDGTVLAAGGLGLAVGGLFVGASQRPGLAALLPLAGALLVSGGASLFGHLWTIDPIVAPLSAVLVLLPGWSLTVGVGEVATGHLASGSARLTAAFVTVLQLALGWVAGAEGVAALVPAGVEPIGMLDSQTLAPWMGLPGVTACFALLFRAEPRHVGWLMVGVIVGWGSEQLPAGMLARAFVGALTIGTLGAFLARRTGLPGQLVTVPGVMVMVPGGALLVAVLQLVRHDPDGVVALVDALGVSGMLVGGLLTARLLLPTIEPERAPTMGESAQQV
jgi:uncharacterized membrane protein YjjB (DUF3815 family)